ncbi:MAG: hypothetical protein IKZ19_04775, partial [Clostridia bacterium]|nr:hypothetical protein [Clostridia bacterium]
MKESRNTAHKASENKKSYVLSVISSSGRRLCLITLILILCTANLLSGCGQNAVEETTAATEAATLTTEDGFVFETGLPEK